MNASTERRFNPLTGEWVLVSSGRNKRPWSGQIDNDIAVEDPPSFADDCYLCPGNERANDKRNPAYKGPFVFDNDFPAFGDTQQTRVKDDSEPLFRSHKEAGRCRVICYSEHHDRTLARMDAESVNAVFELFRDQSANLVADGLHHVQIFENRGEMMGCSNPHPHAQIWAQKSVPTIPGKEIKHMRSYWLQNRSSLLLDYLQREIQAKDRIILENDACVCPGSVLGGMAV